MVSFQKEQGELEDDDTARQQEVGFGKTDPRY